MAKTYEQLLKDIGEYGVVEEVRYPLFFVRGLPQVAVGEMVVFEDGGMGYVVGLEEELAELVILTRNTINPGSHVVRTGEQFHVIAGEALRGATINSLGVSLFHGTTIEHNNDSSEKRLVDVAPPHITQRRAIRNQFVTGTSVIDLMLTLGKGQREAVLGDPTTGKVSFLLTTVQAHSKRGIVVYAAIGKAWNDIKKLYTFIDQSTTKENVILVGTSADDVIGSIFLTPFVAMTIAEYWRDQGEDVLVVFDDLTTHAKFYREIALMARRFPGRESYPGDIFYLHARLLERAGNFKYGEEEGETSSITCLPVAETVRGELTSYIVSNLIGITDGHLLFDETIFNQGRRPAINIPLSVSRVGGNTRSPMVRELHRKLTILLTKHEEAQNFTHFGAELHENMKRILLAGDRFLEFLSQPLFEAVPYTVQVTLSAMIWMGWFNEAKGEIADWRTCLTEAYETDAEVQKTLKELIAAKDLEVFQAMINEKKEYLLSLCQTKDPSVTK